MGRRAAISIGVAQAGRLTRLEAAIPDARTFAEWADDTAQGPRYDEVHLITDEKEPVTRQLIAEVVQRVLAAGDLDRLLIFFSGHGTHTGTTDLWLLSNCDTDVNEAVDVLASFNNAKRLPIGQIGIFADACRSTISNVMYMRGGAIFPFNGNPVQTRPQWDHFFATSLGDIAQEVPGDGDLAAYGVFSRCLFTALSGKEPAVFEARDDPREARVVCSEKLASWLDKRVPLESGRIPGARVQVPDTNPSWRRPDDIYLEERPSLVERLRRAAGEVADDRRDRLAGNAEGAKAWGEKRGLRVRLERRQSSRTKAAALRKVAQARERRDALIGQIGAGVHIAGRESFETRRGLTIHGAEIVEAAARDPVDIFYEEGIQHVRGHADGPQTVALKTREGRWIATVILPDFVGVITVADGAATAFNYQRIHAESKYGTEYQLRHWTALMSVGHVPRAELGLLGDEIRWGKHDNPALGVLAAYAYERAGNLDGVNSMVGYFAKVQQPVLFDLALLSTFPSRRSGGGVIFPEGVTFVDNFGPQADPSGYVQKLPAEIAGTFPLLTRGWAMLEEQHPAVHGELLRLREGVVPSLWTSLRAEQGARLAELIRAGEL